MQHGDKMLIECEYDTTHKKTPTKFGPSSDDEMCNIFFAYYSDSGKLLADDFPDGGSDAAIATVSDLRSHDGPRSKVTWPFNGAFEPLPCSTAAAVHVFEILFCVLSSVTNRPAEWSPMLHPQPAHNLNTAN